MKLSQEGETLLANIGSLSDQLKQLQRGEEFGQDPELADLEGEEEPEEDLEAIFAKLVDGQSLESGEVEQLGEATAGSGELITDLVGRLAAGEALSSDEVALLKAALESGGAEEIQAAEKVAAAIIERSLAGVNRQDAVPMLAGLPGVARGARCLVTKRFASWADARADESPDQDLVRLFGMGRVDKALPLTLEPGEEEEEESDLLRLAVSKVVSGEPLSQTELLELAAENQKGRPLSLAADMPVHKELIPFNRTRPVESLQETAREVRRMIAGEERDIELRRAGRGGKRQDLVRKSLGAAVSVLLGQRQ